MADESVRQSPESAQDPEQTSRRPPKAVTHGWNVVVGVREGGYKRVRKLLREFGHVSTSGFLNVLVM
jgi:hypothetical protein